MTTIVGITDGTHVYMGADSAVTTGNTVYIQPYSKIFKLVLSGDKHETFLLGYGGTSRTADLIRYWFAPPKRLAESPMGPLKYLVGPFVDALRDMLKRYGALIRSTEKDENDRELMDGVLIVGWDGKLYSIHSDFGLVEASDPYLAIGAGQEYAYGAARSMSLAHAAGMPLPDCLMNILEAAEHFNPYTRRPFTFASTDPNFHSVTAGIDT